MENNKEDLIVVLAGYKDKMDTFYSFIPARRRPAQHGHPATLPPCHPPATLRSSPHIAAAILAAAASPRVHRARVCARALPHPTERGLAHSSVQPDPNAFTPAPTSLLQGMASRIGNHIEFPNYSADELVEIGKVMCRLTLTPALTLTLTPTLTLALTLTLGHVP